MSVVITHERGAKPNSGQKMTFEEFLETEFDHNHYEWVEGEAVEMSAAEYSHALLCTDIIRLLGAFLERHDLGVLLTEPFQMKLGETINSRAPDIQVILKQNLSRITRLYTNGPADLVIEIASPSTRSLDRGKKFEEYEIGKVPEYWLLDPLRRRADFLQLHNGTYIPAELDDNGHYHSRILPGLWLDVNWIWERPPIQDILARWQNPPPAPTSP